jgi:V/A-type H+-transporting ATPase subunit B
VAHYARGRELRRLVSIVGEAALSDEDRRLLAFADDVEARLVHQGGERRGLARTLDVAWELLARFPAAELERITPELVARFRPEGERTAA